MIRLKKFAGGTAELLRTEAGPFLTGRASLTEKWDFTMLLFWYVLMPAVTANGFLSAYVIHSIWTQADHPYIHPALPYLYVGLLLAIVTLHHSVARGIASTVKFYFWSTAIYTAAMPLAGWSFVRHLFLRPAFVRTPKNHEEAKAGLAELIFMAGLGFTAVALSIIWRSPFSPFLAGQGVAYFSYPLYGELCSQSLLGRIATWIIFIPGILMLFALYAMWKWGRF